MNGSDDFFFTRLEKGKFDIREGNIDNLSFNGAVSESIQMTFKISFCFLLTNSGASIEVSKDRPFSFIEINLLLLDYILFSMLLTEL